MGSYNLFQALQLAKTARSFGGELNISKFEVYVEVYNMAEELNKGL